jgi:hypothetical protein
MVGLFEPLVDPSLETLDEEFEVNDPEQSVVPPAVAYDAAPSVSA